MRAAQIGLALLTGVLIAASAVLFIFEENTPAWAFTVFGLFGYFCLLGMIVSDARPRTPLPPP